MEDRTVVRNQAPPPPSEVKIRTMRSDLSSMAQSGGGIPRFESVTVDGLSMEKEYAAPSHSSNIIMPATATQPQPLQQPIAAQPSEPTQFASTTVQQSTISSSQSSTFTSPVSVIDTQQSSPSAQPVAAAWVPPQTDVAEPIVPKKDMYPIFIIAVVAILALSAVGYFAYITFFTGTPAATQSDQTAQLPSQTATTPAPSSTMTTSTIPATSGASTTSPTTMGSPSTELSTAHVSLFKKPADQIITVDFTGVTAATYRKTMSASLATANAASSMIEINPKGSDGNSLSMQGLLSVAGASVLTPQALGSFAPDATFYVYRDRNGLWPGYILSLSTGQTSSSVAASVQQLELSTNISNIFIVDPGTPSSDGFTGSATAGVPVRILPFSGPSIPSYFTYGWYGNYLILSTSKNGFAAAVADL